MKPKRAPRPARASRACWPPKCRTPRPKLPRITMVSRIVSDRKKQRLELLYRLREMNVEQARAEHVAAQTELEQRRETRRGHAAPLEELDAVVRANSSQGGAGWCPNCCARRSCFAASKSSALEQQRAEEASQSELHRSRARPSSARDSKNCRWSSAWRRATRRPPPTKQMRRGFVDLDEAGVLARTTKRRSNHGRRCNRTRRVERHDACRRTRPSGRRTSCTSC